MSMEKSREQFEAWECDADQGPQTDPIWLMYDAETNTYPLDKIQDRWEVWQESRAALVVELPRDTRGMDSYEIKKATVSAIEAAGVKVKP